VAVGCLALVLALLLVACGDPAPDGASNGGDDVAGSPSGVEVSGALDAKPEIAIPDSEPPSELEVTDLVVGDGDEVAEGATVTAHYVGQSWSTGEQFDASWDRGDPIPFGLDQVIAGWTEGIPGMRVGGRRLLVIPPDKGYGPAGSPPVIGPNETLVFVVDVVATE
jgi:peptidylprolyl isomerase